MRPKALDKAIDSIERRPAQNGQIKRVAREFRGLPLPPDGRWRDELCRRHRLSPARLSEVADGYEHALVLYRAASKWRTYDHGARRRRAAGSVTLVWPRPLALRLPLILDSYWPGDRGVSGEDVYGDFRCNVGLRSTGVGLVGLIFGLLSDPAAGGNQAHVDANGNVDFSMQLAYQVLVAADPYTEPGGEGLAIIKRNLLLLEKMEIWGDVKDQHGYRGKDGTRDMAVPRAPGRVLKAVDDVDAPDGYIWVAFSDPREFTKHTQRPVRVAVDPYWRDLVGVKGSPGDRVYINPAVWRQLRDDSRAMLLEIRARPAKTTSWESRPHVQFQNYDKWARRLGLAHLPHSTREQIILTALHHLYCVDQMCAGYGEPKFHRSSNNVKQFVVYLSDKPNGLRAVIKPHLRWRVFRSYAAELADERRWPGDEAPNAPPDTS